MPPTKPDRFLSIAEAAQMLGLGVGTLRNGQCETDQIPRIRMGRRIVFSQAVLEALMARKIKEANERKAAQRNIETQQLSDKRRKQRVVRQSLLRIVNGERMKKNTKNQEAEVETESRNYQTNRQEAKSEKQCRCNCGCKQEAQVVDGRRLPLCEDCYRRC